MLKLKVINQATNTFYESDLQPQQANTPECLIGRHPSCDLVLDGPTVSRVHGRILFQDQRCYFSDLGSTDGSRLNNESIAVTQPYALATDDVIRVGEFALLVESIDSQQVQSTTATPSGSPMVDQMTVQCIQIIQETVDVKTFRFRAEPTRLFDYKPGQFVTLKLNIDGKPVNRSYSISSSPSRPHILEITVKRVPPAQESMPPGLVSNWLHDHLTVGQTLDIQGPFGHFNCIDHPADNYLFVSAGSGITPMMSMAQWLCDTGSTSKIVFIHSARSPEDIICRQRLELLARQNPNLELAWTLTRPTTGSAWTGYRGRLRESLLKAIVPKYECFTTFVCGPQGFMSSTKSLFESLGFPMKNYFEESFGAAKAPRKTPPKVQAQPTEVAAPTLAQSEGTDDPVVIFANSNKEVSCDLEDSLLDVAEQAGIDLTSGCRMGSCGVCKHQLLEGDVEYDDEPGGLSDSDRKNNHVLVCVARPVGRVVLSA
ncbi:FAD-binding oxidoreductase [Leptothoe spongobia]|uniref:FHA domain-containing protein n=1 Tax=Leptothoe spongobia TAU-MAC 1115 TaxID=1967444 RepID=A0A947GLZ0_9CYAN|nr:FAD-binding oxidoreductase [Leptothoe spongobia]MBT9315191.1 FHA domain-containing protein [Leptothoe spongobia TAU-MAC 1115]